MDLAADCAITFSWVEEQVFPDAFLKDEWGRTAQLGWGIDENLDVSNENALYFEIDFVYFQQLTHQA